MGRLIDADALLNEFNPDSDALIDNILARTRIAKHPTAYDLDKVVEKLEEQMNTYLRLHKEEEAKNGYTNKSQILYDKACSFEYAINIVKRGGGGTDDVCEWKPGKVNDEWHPECDPNAIYNVFGVTWFKRCPYCGKRINVVEYMKIGSAIRKLKCEREKNNTPSVDVAYSMAIEALEKKMEIKRVIEGWEGGLSDEIRKILGER